VKRRAFIGLGSNLGERLGQLRAAVAALAERGLPPRRASSVYESAPHGPVRDQPAFLNAVVEVESELAPRELLQRCQEIEAALGREHTVLVKGPRAIDLDLLLVEELVASWPELVLPHPELTRRAFVLVPLLELEPGLCDPRTGRPLAEQLEGLAATQALRRAGNLAIGSIA